MDESKPTPSPDPGLKKDCPACHYVHAEEVRQCEKCGAIFSKWKDEKQRQAEARLAQLAQESSRGLPKWLTTSLLAAVAIPLVLFLVPDIGARVMGGQLNYKLKKEKKVSHIGTWTTIVAGPTDFNGKNVTGTATLDQLTSTLETSLLSTETDSGGNTSYRKSYKRLFLQKPDGTILDREPHILETWKNEWTMNRFGGRISTLGSLGMPMQAMSLQQQALMKMADSYYFDETGKDPPAQDPYAQIVESANLGDLGHLDMSTYFQYPRQRFRPGFTFDQNIALRLKSKLFKMDLEGSIPFKVVGFERRGKDFLVVVSWNNPMNGQLSSPSQELSAFINNAPVRAFYRGKAWINYADGILQGLEGDLETIIETSLPDASPINQLFGLSSSLPAGQRPCLRLEGKHKITRI